MAKPCLRLPLGPPLPLYACHHRMAKKVLLYSDQGGLLTNLHSTLPSVCSHRRPFLLGLILAFRLLDDQLAFHEVLPARNCKRRERKASSTAANQERQHSSKPIHRSCCQR